MYILALFVTLDKQWYYKLSDILSVLCRMYQTEGTSSQNNITVTASAEATPCACIHSM